MGERGLLLDFVGIRSDVVCGGGRVLALAARLQQHWGADLSMATISINLKCLDKGETNLVDISIATHIFPVIIALHALFKVDFVVAVSS